MINKMTTDEIRKAFLDYFKSLDHQVIPSGSLVPANDPTLLFTNAGMVQFKEVFLGIEQRSYTRATSAQRCVRAGGKHNDLEHVGHTRRHHTFFEMLGNFSFGDYFKREAIQFAWQFITNILKIPKERLWITVFRDDKESEAIWLDEIKVDPKRFSRCGEKDNFWSMGDTGPCGPCSEIFYDHGPHLEGEPPGTPEAEGDRYVEIWNLVFMQYNRGIEGKLSPLPKFCVDTGMGLERVATIMQGVHDNYEIDIFKQLLQSLADLIGYKDFLNPSMRVIVDHIRSAVFLIFDGVMPSNEQRGYVLRRIIRRAVRHGFKLGQKEPFFYRLTNPVIAVMGDPYPEIKKSRELIAQVIEQEEIQFFITLEKGLKILDKEIAQLHNEEVPGELVFQLYDTYGFPPDLTADIARERGLILDYPGFEQAMAKQRELSQRTQQFSIDQTQHLYIAGKTDFTGYTTLTDEGTVTALLYDNQPVTELNVAQKGIVVLDRTPFYAESGGQVGDSGYLYFDKGYFRVYDTKRKGYAYLHYGEVVKGVLHLNENVRAEVDESRKEIVLNHSATHLLHEALRRVLGEHVVQKGSLVEAKRLRFDFSHSKALTREQLYAVEGLVNQQIRANLESAVTETTLEEAKAMGALALFGEKYDERIRVVKMGEFSMEICGGTHVHHTGDIGLFKIISETASAAGVRRIEAVTGNEALQWIEQQEKQLYELSALLKTTSDNIQPKLFQLIEENKKLMKELNRLKQRMVVQQSDSLVEQAVEVEGIHVLAVQIGTVERDTLRNTMDQLKQELGHAAIVLASIQKEKVLLVAGVTKYCLKYFNATELLNHVAYQVGGKGGGRPDLAQGGGTQPEHLTQALNSVVDWVTKKLNR